MAPKTAKLPDGQEVFCINPYEVDFSVHEIFSADPTEHGITLPRDGVYFDVGANIGLYAIYLRRHCPDATIYAYEPMPEVFAALEANVAALKPRAEAIQLALSTARGKAEFDYFPGIAAMSTSKPDVGRTMSQGIRNILQGASKSHDVRELVDQSGAGAKAGDAAFLDDLLRTEKVSVDTDTLSNEIARLGVERIDLLKIDTEGAELDVLAGLSEDDWHKIEQLIVEVHLGDAVLEQLSAELAGRGYRISVDKHPLADGGAAVSQIYAVRTRDGRY